MLKELIKITNTLDQRGLTKEADYLDAVIRKLAAKPCSAESVRYRIEFDRNEWKIDDSLYSLADAACLTENGMQHDRKFMTIEGGTSGTGTSAANEVVMHRRINEAMRHLYESYAGLGPHGLSYSYDEFKNMANIELAFNTVRPGSTLPTKEEAPEDVDDLYYNGHQYVQITIGPVVDTPNFGRLANEFMAATVEVVGTDDDAVFKILQQLRDHEDFQNFNKELHNNHGRTFYHIACDKIISSTPGTLSAWITSKIGLKGLGPAEIGEDDQTVASQLQRLGAKPIDC